MVKSWSALLLLSSLVVTSASAQQLPELKVPNKGDTVNLSVQSGTRSSLSFGSSTSFGSSVNLSGTEGLSTSASSSLAPAAGATLDFSIGKGSTPGAASANIDNLRTQGNGQTTVGGSPINATDGTFSSGKADLQGVQSQLNITLDNTKTGFQARTNTLHKTYGATPGQDGEQLQTANQTANASGNASVNSNINVDINSTNFTNVFLQAF